MKKKIFKRYIQGDSGVSERALVGRRLLGVDVEHKNIEQGSAKSQCCMQHPK